MVLIGVKNPQVVEFTMELSTQFLLVKLLEKTTPTKRYHKLWLACCRTFHIVAVVYRST